MALAGGQRLTANPLSLLEEARDGVLYCTEVGQLRPSSSSRLLATSITSTASITSGSARPGS